MIGGFRTDQVVLWVQFLVGAGSSHTVGGLACGPMRCFPSEAACMWVMDFAFKHTIF